MAFNLLIEKMLIPYITLGDPSIATTESLVIGAFESGAGMVEIGIPFSDPIADGPVIQASHFRALSQSHAPTIQDGLDLVARVKRIYKKPIVLMSSVNLIMAYGVIRFFETAKAVGLDGIVIPDVSFEDAAMYLNEGQRHNVAVVLLVSPLCKPDRLVKIVKAAQGFLYVIATTGTTGARESMSQELPTFVARIKQIKDIPVAIGFGISRPEHVREVLGYADGAIVGSHFVGILETEGEDAVLSEIRRFNP
jgi:tryptophan synthase alpha chain